MKKTAVFLIFIFLLLTPINAFADDGRFDTAGEMYHYFQAHKKFPDYFCGMWSTDGSVYNMTIAVLNTEEGEKGKQEILDWVRKDEGITFTYGKYSLNHLWQIHDEVVGYFRSDAGLVLAAIHDDENFIEVGVLEEYKDNEKTKGIIKSLTDKYGDAVSVRYTGSIYAYDENAGIVHTAEKLTFATDTADSPFGMFGVFAVLVFLMSGTLWFVVMNYRRKSLVTTDGNTISISPKLSDKQLENMVKSVEAEVPSDLKDRIFKEIERRK